MGSKLKAQELLGWFCLRGPGETAVLSLLLEENIVVSYQFPLQGTQKLISGNLSTGLLFPKAGICLPDV